MYCNSASNCKIDGIAGSVSSPIAIPVGSIIESTAFNWSYGARNMILYAYTGAGFTVSS